tara:strand:+ start:208 stop:759 length:552 start_codon:yes stop_codon:yes gene_type:complete
MLSRIFAILLFLFLSPLFLILGLIIISSDGFPIVYKQKRIGKDNIYFYLYKFRTMKKNTPELATHLMNDPDKYLINFGKFMRRNSLDEIPQIFNIIKGEMSFVGPRPALHNQDDLKALRTKNNIHLITPGLTGWAQINGRDELSINDKVAFDKFYIEKKSMVFDIEILIKTFFKVINKRGVSH